MRYEIGEPIIRQVSEGPRQGVVRGIVQHGSTSNYYVRTGFGM